MALGSAVHILSLEPKNAMDRFYVMPKGKKTTDEDIAAAGRRIMIREQSLEEAKLIAQSVLDSPAAKKELDGATFELDLFFDIEGNACKSRIDGYNTGTKTLIELKTTNEIYARDFCSTIIRSDYHVQCAFYREALKRNNMPVERVVIIQVTTESPYLCRVYELEDLFLDAGDRRINKVFKMAADLIKGWKPAQEKDSVKLNYPEWAKETL
jgi:hypothetical protein